MAWSDSDIIIYQTEDGRTKIDVRMDGATVWLTQSQMAELFQTTKQNVSLHIGNAFKEGEIDPSATVKEYLTVQKQCRDSVVANFETTHNYHVFNTSRALKSVQSS